MDTKNLGIICLNSTADIYIHFYKNGYKYYNVNIKSFNLSKLINLLLSIIRGIIISGRLLTGGQNMINRKPFIKWAGGKEKEWPIIKENLPKKFSRYVERFVVGGAVYLNVA